MLSWLSDLLKQLLQRKAEAIVALLVPTVIALIEAGQSYLVQFVPEPAPVWALRAIALSIASMLIGYLSYIYFRPKFKFLPTGINQDIKTGAFFCSPCFVKNKLHSPLRDYGHGWSCSVCGKSWHDPLRPQDMNKYKPSVDSRF